MRLPNGFGSVTKLSGKRRNPWRARKTKGWDFDPSSGKARQIYINIGCYPTKQAALTALAEYNADPYDLGANKITFEEVYRRWSEEHFNTIVPSACRTWISAYNHSKPLHNMKMRDIKTIHLESAISQADVGTSTKQRMKSLYNQMFRYALKHEIVEKNYADLCNTVKKEDPQIIRVPYTSEEIRLLWDNVDFPFVDMVLIGIYSGWRPQELAILKTADVDPDERTMRGGLKTEAGKNRIVPIHPAIYDLVLRNYEQSQANNWTYLFNDESSQSGLNMTYDKYRARFNKINKRLGLVHRPHDTRHTFITLGKEAGMDEYVLKLIVGHAIEDITEKVYTHRTMEQLHEEIEKIKAEK